MDTFFGHRQLPALDDLDRLLGLVAGVLLGVLNLLNDVVALEDLAEDDVLAIQPPEQTVVSTGVPEAPVFVAERTR